MEVLLFILAILFSVFSALMERRRRRKQLEEAQQQHAEVQPAKPVVAEPEKEEEPAFGWPFDGDPFEEPVRVEVEADPVEAEREALEAERAALAVERRTVAAERQAVERLMEPRPAARRPRRARNRWFLNPQTARDAIIYMEILGKPKSEREEW